MFLDLVRGRPPHDFAHDLLDLSRRELAVGPAFGRDQIRTIVFAGSQVRLNSDLRYTSYPIPAPSVKMGQREVVHMRDDCAEILRIRFRRALVASRADMGISRGEMAQLLSMSLRSYSDLERGAGCCGAVTLALFLIRVCPDPAAFLADLREAMSKELEGAT